jgi:hypothetical protein
MLESVRAAGANLSDALSSLQLRGWVALRPESRELPTLAVARAIGEPIRSPTGDLVRKLVPKDPTDAISGTFSHVYGKADFPLHTDTAFWPVPARYLVMRVTGDTRRPTMVAPIPQPFASTITPEVVSSVWIIRGVRPFYCSMQFRVNGEVGVRYDPLTMIPANAAAAKVQSGLPTMLAQLPTFSVDWEAAGTVIVDNWRALHGRGPEPAGEGQRVLERIYVR